MMGHFFILLLTLILNTHYLMALGDNEEWTVLPSSSIPSVTVTQKLTGLRAMSYNSIYGVNQKKQLFGEGNDRIPSQSHIYQLSTLDCGVLAPIAAIASHEKGKEFIQTIMQDNTQTIDVTLYGNQGKDLTNYEVDKARDWSWNKTAKTRLWTHILERALEVAFDQELPTYRSEGGINAGYTFQAIFGKKNMTSKKTNFYTDFDKVFSEEVEKHFSNIDNSTTRFSVVSRSPHDPDRKDLNDGIFAGHYYAITSDVIMKDGQEGVMVFNTLNRSNYKMSYFYSYETDREFFVSLDDLSKKFSEILSIYVTNL